MTKIIGEAFNVLVEPRHGAAHELSDLITFVEYDVSFDASWIDDLIAVLQKAKAVAKVVTRAPEEKAALFAAELERQWCDDEQVVASFERIYQAGIRAGTRSAHKATA